MSRNDMQIGIGFPTTIPGVGGKQMTFKRHPSLSIREEKRSMNNWQACSASGLASLSALQLAQLAPFLRKLASPPKLILLVEDDPANAQLFLHILTQEASFHVFWATNGRAALHFTQHVKPQLFLLEYSLPDMNGIILYDRLHARKELATVPALIVGASLKEGEDAIKQRGLLAVEKPFDPDEFLSAIESLFASSSGKPRW